ncbi:serine/threonine protein kinase [Stackebrandtia albiflava]|uniref:non-specific serine/threonine protein kinase n=1 Tax=Stackebrandtia albiflava TaxID=406432 RepID=A0A562V235_9ACTN|nr:protein kinase [Stackebrandtia albiflava]TWJ11966.1 serine/threonine protein kinase [Stackebrandtia albiflava]
MKPLDSSDPAKVGPYRTLAVLGSGAMGRVLLGRDAEGTLVAVKRVHAQFSEDDGFRARFRREVIASRRVRGRYTASVVADDTDARVPWMASEYVDGPTLQNAVDTGGPLDETAVFRLAAWLAAALMDVHRAGLIHRDLKPSNILLTDDGVKVIDFGIARAVDASTLTGTGTVMGSYAFMAPEQILADKAEPASDVFALGAVLGFAATGTGPFHATSVPAITHRILNDEPRLDGIGADLRGLIAPCLAKAPGDRPKPADLMAAVPPDLSEAPGETPRLWGAAVHRLISAQRADVAACVDRTHVTDTVVDPGETVVDAASAGSRVRQPPSDGTGDSSKTPDVTPYVRDMAEKLGVDLSVIRGTGPGGAIRATDVRTADEAARAARRARERAEAKRKAEAARKAEAKRRAETAQRHQGRTAPKATGGGAASKSTSDRPPRAAGGGAGTAPKKTGTTPSSTPPSGSSGASAFSGSSGSSASSGSSGSSASSGSSGSSASSGSKKQEDTNWGAILGVIGAIILVAFLIDQASDESSDDTSGETSTTDTSSYEPDTDYDTDYNDVADDEVEYDPPTSEAPDPTAGCSEAADTVSIYVDRANAAMEVGDNAGAVDAFQSMANQLRYDALLANDDLVALSIDILADDSERLATALAYQDNASYAHWREVWTGDRDDLWDTCYG